MVSPSITQVFQYKSLKSLMAAALCPCCVDMSSKPPWVFHFDFQILLVPSHKSNYCILYVHCHAPDMYLFAHIRRHTHCRISITHTTQQRHRLSDSCPVLCDVLPTVWMFDYSKGICLKTDYAASVKLLMNYVWIWRWNSAEWIKRG